MEGGGTWQKVNIKREMSVTALKTLPSRHQGQAVDTQVRASSPLHAERCSSSTEDTTLKRPPSMFTPQA